jgi:hypothetical protein
MLHFDVILSGMRCRALFLALLVGSVVTACTSVVVDDGPENACHEQADCFSDMCTDSQCIEMQCVHVRREDGLICIGQHAPSTVFFGLCSSGRCVKQN